MSRVTGTSTLVFVKLPLRTCVMYVVGGRTLMVERSRVSLPPELAMNVIVPEPSLSFTCIENAVLCSRPSAMRSVCVGALICTNSDSPANLHVCVFSGAFDIVRHGHAGLEFIAGRRERWHTWRNHKRPAHKRVSFRCASGIIGHRHRHHR